ncbi:MAG: NUDIX domain-containing protein [Acidobacteriota bacterium]
MTQNLDDLPLRRSSRLVIVDPEGRLLLFRYVDEHRPPFWATTGGELRPGETYEDAARREALEETGLPLEPGPVLRDREAVYAVARSTPARWRERYFLVHSDRTFDPDDALWTDEERATVRSWKWWTLDALRACDEDVLPPWIPDLLADLAPQ